jgi:hypothetical protein
MFTSTGPQLGQFEAGALATAIGTESSVVVGGLVVTGLAATLALGTPAVRTFNVRDVMVGTSETVARP